MFVVCAILSKDAGDQHERDERPTSGVVHAPQCEIRRTQRMARAVPFQSGRAFLGFVDVARHLDQPGGKEHWDFPTSPFEATIPMSE